ncbi:c-type cytochrome [Plastoroseomonas hellenica]|uniref:c-type cytochrome n=1 Tax=Plastoroseomonas hellenica TaxID=2687306 RepID=UPI001BA9AD3F|nr:c-type cytochrome [Plastoroseomonas hellenica]
MRAAAALLVLLPGLAMGQEGRAVFEARCASCHAMEAGAPPGPGPNLAGLAGRRVGGDQAFGYSPALEAARAEGRTWDSALLERFLSDPDAMFPGLWMGENGLREASDRAAVARFLTGPAAPR